ncbi:MAG: hypothetical protein L6R40_000587 [Gallowayella cf. fulva]|nr:MAG: hypothetical protein L6R40_000587 [Xanthomendoza cf. fulva]
MLKAMAKLNPTLPHYRRPLLNDLVSTFNQKNGPTAETFHHELATAATASFPHKPYSTPKQQEVTRKSFKPHMHPTVPTARYRHASLLGPCPSLKSRALMATKADPNLTPAITAPPGHQSNLVNPPSKDGIFIACCVLVIVLSTPWVLVRLYTRRWISAKLWWDDLACVLGWAFMVSLSALLINVLQWGGGSDLWNVSKANWKLFKLHFHDTQIIARVGMCCTKVSFLLFYQRLLIPVGTRWTPIWWAIWLCFWYNVLYAIALVITVLTACIGKDAIVAAGGQCVNEYAVLICASVINVSSDIMILVIPIVGIWGLHMPAEKKRKLSAVFIIGGLAVLSSVARLGYQIKESGNPNQSLAIMVVSLLNLAEQFIGVIVSCMPILPAFYRHLKPHHSTSSSSSPAHKGDLSASILGFQHKGKLSSGGGKRSKDDDARVRGVG